MNKEQSLIKHMESCEQTSGQTIYQHGLSVWEYAKKICAGKFDDMRIPEWFKDNFFQIVNSSVPKETLKRYCIYHDCGKPFCKETDDEGQTRFPNHAEISAGIYRDTFIDDQDGAWLVANDMAIHSYTSAQIASLIESTDDKSLLLTLIISAFAEIHSNATMFGGIESTNFKIKWKKVNQRAKQIFKACLKEDGHKFYSYIILRKDMENSHKIVQASHATMEHSKYTGDEHPSIICVEVRNENKLKVTAVKLMEAGIEYKIFREGAGVHEDEITAICTDPIKFDDPKREVLRRYQLVK